MTDDIRTTIDRQVRRVRRRMLTNDLIRYAIGSTFIALLLTIGWLLAEPYVWAGAPIWLRWAVLGGTVGVALAVAVTLAMLRRPDATKAALWLDAEFALQERVTTSLALSNEDAGTWAGQALLNDALARVQNLRVGERFPIRVGWTGWLVPSAAGALALIALFYEPTISTAVATTTTKTLTEAEKAELDKKIAPIQKPKRDPNNPLEKAKSEDLKKLEAKLEEISRQPRDSAPQLRERIKDMTPLEDEIKKLERERNDKARMMQQQLQMKDALVPNEAAKDGPGNEMRQALAEGDLDKAKQEVEKLAKKLANNELSEQDKQNLAKQMNELGKKLSDLSNQKGKEDMLKKLHEEGKLDAEALQRELQNLKQDNEKLKDLQKLANKMNQCQNCMKAGDMAGVQKALQEAAEQLGQADRDQNELNDLRDALQNLQEAKDALAKAADDLEGMPGGDNNGNGAGGSEMQGTQPSRGDYADGRGVGQGKRPDGEQGKTRPYDARQNAQFNPKGQKIFDGFTPGQAFKKKSSVDLAADMKQAAQEAPEVIENQRIPKAARDMAKGYFKNLGGQAEGEKPKEEKKEEKK